jgi:stage II sporulation protein D
VAILSHMSTRIRPNALCAGVVALLMVATLGVPTIAAEPPVADDAPASAAAATSPTTGSAGSTTSGVQPAADPEPTPEPRYRFTGYGTDHGVGLSQRGAAGRAKAGQTYDQILHHYFYRVELGTGPGGSGPDDTVPADTTIRALVVKSYKAASTQTPLIQGGKGGPGNTQMSRWTIDTPAAAGEIFPYSWRLVLIGTGAKGAWHLEVQDSHGDRKKSFTDDDARVTVAPVTTETDPGRIRVLIRPDTKYDTYEGVVRIGRANGRVRVVNIVPIEPFVRSVTPQELGPANLTETLKSQAVVARSYFLAGRNPSTSWLAFDVQSDRVSESYKGTKGENAVVTRSVDATAFQVLKYQKSDGAWYIARTFYHAVGGGATEASQNVFTGETGKPGAKTPYLRGGPDLCPDPRADDYPNGPQEAVPCDETARDYFWSSRAFTLSELSDILRKDSRTNVGTLKRWPVEAESTFRSKRAAALLADAKDSTPAPTNRGISGRLTWVVLVGTRHGKTVTKRVAGWLFKSVFNTNRGSGDPLGSTMIFRTRVN